MIIMEITCGVPQGFIFSPHFWIMYDTVFRLLLPTETAYIGIADDTIIVAESNTVSAMEDRANTALAIVAEQDRR